MNGSNALRNSVNNLIEFALFNMHTGMPCKIVSVDDYVSKQTISVLPLVKFNSYLIQGETEYPIIPNVFVGVLSANNGKTLSSLPIKKGDFGFLHFSEHDLDNFSMMSGKNPVDTETSIKFSLTDAVFVPYVRPSSQPLTDVSADNVVIKHDNIKLELIADGKLTINNTGEELISLLIETLDTISKAKTITMMGASPFTIDSIALMEALKLRLETFKKND